MLSRWIFPRNNFFSRFCFSVVKVKWRRKFFTLFTNVLGYFWALCLCTTFLLLFITNVMQPHSYSTDISSSVYSASCNQESGRNSSFRKIGKVELLSLGCILWQKVSYNQKTTVNRCFPIKPNQPCFSSSQQATRQSNLFGNMASAMNPSVSVSALMTLIDFTLSNARRFSSSMGNPRTLRG